MDEQSYRKLEVWQRSMGLVDSIYELSRRFPDDERFGLTQQIHRAVVSVSSNIAEGYGRQHRREYVQHLFVSRGSLMEVETQLIAAVRQNICTREEAIPV